MAPKKGKQAKKSRPEVVNEPELSSATTGYVPSKRPGKPQRAAPPEPTRGRSPTPVKRANIEDYLDEDAELPTQKFFVLSYLLPDKTNELEVPMIKVRGSYRSVDDCNSRIETLKPIDTYHNMYISEVGKWGGLFDEDTIKKMGNVDIQYREQQLNTMMHNYKEQKDKNDLAFETRTKQMKERAKYEGTKEGQELLASQRENPISVKTRLISVNDQIKELTERLVELEELKRTTQIAFDNLTEIELEEVADYERKARGEAIKRGLIQAEPGEIAAIGEASGVSELPEEPEEPEVPEIAEATELPEAPAPVKVSEIQELGA